MSLREAEANSIREFVAFAGRAGYLRGRVLDYGCGKQPYRDIVKEAGGSYYGFDRASYPANLSGEDIGDQIDVLDPLEEWDAILMTQVIQYIPLARHDRIDVHLPHLFEKMRVEMLAEGGHLVITYPTNWPEVELGDLHRFTKAGMEHLLVEAAFEIVYHDFRHGFQHEGVSFVCGYGVIARA